MKTKIVLLLLPLVFIASAVLLFISITTFRNDKIAYIFETITNQTSSSANQFKGELESVHQIALSYLTEYNKTGKLKKNPEDILPDSSILQSIEIYGYKNGQELLSSISKVDSKVDLKLVKLLLDRYALKSILNKKIIFYQNNLVYELTIAQDTPFKVVILTVFKSNMLSDAFENSNANHPTYVVNKNFQSIDTFTDSVNANSPLEISFPNLKETLTNQIISDIKTGMIKSNTNEDWIFSSSPLSVDDYYLVNLIPVSKALAVMKTVYFKSIVSFLMIMSLVIIVGLISASSLTSQLNSLTEATQKVISGDFSTQIKVIGKDEISVLTSGFNTMISELTRLMSETVEKARMENELKTAQLVQENLLPPEKATYSNCKVAGYYKSASECGGDWWFHSEDENAIHIIIADATGHGASAALMTSAIKSAFSLLITLNLNAVEMMTKLNQALCGVSHGKIMMTAFYFKIDKKNNTADYVNASHEAPIVIDLALDKITKKDLQFLNENNSARLGQSPDTIYTSTNISLNANMRLFFYTDGIFDIRNGENDKISEREFYKNFLSLLNYKTSLEDFSINIIDFLVTYHKAPQLDDDITICNLEMMT